ASLKEGTGGLSVVYGRPRVKTSGRLKARSASEGFFCFPRWRVGLYAHARPIRYPTGPLAYGWLVTPLLPAPVTARFSVTTTVPRPPPRSPGRSPPECPPTAASDESPVYTSVPHTVPSVSPVTSNSRLEPIRGSLRCASVPGSGSARSSA